MKKKLSILSVALLFWGYASGVRAGDPDEGVTNEKPATTGQTPGPSGDEKGPFTPYWAGQVAYSFNNQTSQSGQGQDTQEISLTGNFYFSESGHFISMVAGGGQETLEGVNSSYGTFSLGGGLGFGVFQPSFTLAFEQGAQALNSWDASLTLNFQLAKAFALGVLLEGNPQSHQGALSTVLGGNSDQIDEIDSLDWTGGLEANLAPWDFLTLTLTLEQDNSTTTQWQDILHNNVHALNQTEQIPSADLGADINLLKDLTLNLSFQVGEEIVPAGISYNPILKQTMNNPTSTSQPFTGYALGLTYNL